MKAALRFLRQELDHLLRAVVSLTSDHAIHGYLAPGPPPAATRRAGGRGR